MFAKPPGYGGLISTFFLDQRAETPEFRIEILPDFREGNFPIEVWLQRRQDDPWRVILLWVFRTGFDRVYMDLVDRGSVPHKVGGVVPESDPQVVLPLPNMTLGSGFELGELFEKFGFQVFPVFGSKLASHFFKQLQLFPQLRTFPAHPRLVSLRQSDRYRLSRSHTPHMEPREAPSEEQH